jgi:hypothetical protein
MISIAVVGANGQVGSEVSLVLSKMSGVTVIPIVRSALGAALLERCGLACRIGSLSSDDDAARLLAGCDLVADFSLPGGLPAEVRRAMRTNIRQAIRHAPSGAPYVFMSSTMAFGMPSGARSYANYRVARTPYAANKRHAERYAHWLGFRTRRPTYALRLGQVFGELQAVSGVMMADATPRPLELEAGDTPSDAVFCTTIALALRNIALGLEKPGTHSLLEAPEWTWKRLYAFHATQAGYAPRFVDVSPTPVDVTSLLGAVTRAVRATAIGSLTRNKDLLVAQLLPHFTSLELRLKARHSMRRAMGEIRSPEDREVVRIRCCAGPVPGTRLGSLRDSFETMQGEAAAVRELLRTRLGVQSRNPRA